jgi:hypothetical protein
MMEYQKVYGEPDDHCEPPSGLRERVIDAVSAAKPRPLYVTHDDVVAAREGRISTQVCDNLQGRSK